MDAIEKDAIRYFIWDGDACRLYCHANGDLTADIYRAGKGALPIQAVELLTEAREISEQRYRDLVQEEIMLGRKKAKSDA